MATTAENKGIVNHWSLIAFARTFGPTMKLAPFVNKDGDQFKSCVFIKDDDTKTLVGFSSNMGELTAQQIVSMKDDLQVVELTTGHYYLCKNGGTWEDVDLGL